MSSGDGSKKEKRRALARNWQKTKKSVLGREVGSREAATAAGEEGTIGDEDAEAVCGLAPRPPNQGPPLRPGV